MATKTAVKKKPAAKKALARKTFAKKPAVKKPAAKKTAAKKAPARKSVARRPARRKMRRAAYEFLIRVIPICRQAAAPVRDRRFFMFPPWAACPGTGPSDTLPED